MNKPRLLDLFSGAGGATKGYQQAGFYVVGVDIAPQSRYCGDEFIQADALTFPFEGFDAYHASPPCQSYSRSRNLPNVREHPRLIGEMRTRLHASGKPWIIENVQGAPMGHFMMLCGTQFGLHVYRHRQFESNLLMFAPGSPCDHPHELPPDFLCIFGNSVRGRQIGNRGNSYQRHSVSEGRAAMGIDWSMTQRELSQAIPPAYTHWIGRFLMDAIQESRAAS